MNATRPFPERSTGGFQLGTFAYCLNLLQIDIGCKESGNYSLPNLVSASMHRTVYTLYKRFHLISYSYHHLAAS